MNKIKKRSEVDSRYTWNTADIYESEEAYQISLKQIKLDSEQFVKKYSGKLGDKEIILCALKEYEGLLKKESWLEHYSFLLVAEDINNSKSNAISHRVSDVLSQVNRNIAFLDSELLSLDSFVLDEVSRAEPNYQSFIRHLKKSKAMQQSVPVQEALEHLKPTLYSGERMYQQMKLNDMDFGSFTVGSCDYLLSFSSYEDIYAFHPDTQVRRAAFDKFSEVLGKYQNVASHIYYTHVNMEKTLATMHGFESVIDYLLYEQEVDRELYNRQLDTLMEQLAPVMQKYVTHLKEIHGLEKLTFADLRMELDPTYAPTVTILQSKELISDALNPLGEAYRTLLMAAYPERWVDFVQNEGKETGGFYSCPFGNHPYILLTWSNQLSNVFTLIHELGHAGQGLLSAQNNSILGCYLSTYLSETPATFNELLLTDSLVNKAQDKAMKRFALSTMVSKTYFHNFVTHLLEAVYQREVYELLDAGKTFQADTLNEIKKRVLSDFWGDAVELNDGAELTWMRQSHYYGGLYSYTYSAGLTIATQAFLNIKNHKDDAVKNWLDFLALGDQCIPIDAAKVAGVDISTNQPLLDTVSYIDDCINQIIKCR